MLVGVLRLRLFFALGRKEQSSLRMTIPTCDYGLLRTENCPLLLHPHLPKQKRIHIRELFNLLGHRLARAVPRFRLDPQ